jgi:prefoldin subunit 5
LKLVNFLKSKESEADTIVTTRYNLADMLYAKADVDCASGVVNLWLGANVMLEYTYDEAIELLQVKQNKNTQDLEETLEDLAFVRNQIITAEVNISRIYNWDVRRKRSLNNKDNTEGEDDIDESKQ